MLNEIIILSFSIIGFHALTRPGKILSIYGRFLRSNGDTRFALANPLGECSVCMSSFVTLSVFVYRYFIENGFDLVLFYVLNVPVLSSVVEILLFTILQRVKKKVPKNALKWLRTINLFLYFSTIVFFAVYALRFDAVNFFVYCFALAGFTLLIESIIAIRPEIISVSDSIETIPEVMLNLDNKNSKNVGE